MRLKISFIITLIFISLLGCDDSELLKPGDPILDPSNRLIISIDQVQDARQGTSVKVPVLINNSLQNINRIELTFAYNPKILSFQSADPGELVINCGWEYYTYRYRSITIDTTLYGVVSISAIAEVNNGAGNHPDCFSANASGSNVIADLNFLVTNDRTYECQSSPVQFFWEDCKDNYIVSQQDSTYFVEKTIDNNSSSSISYPSFNGYQNSCDTSFNIISQLIDFNNGNVDLICADSIDARGDINLNNIANEVADAVLYVNYFVYGLGVFTMNEAGQIAASDVNADGLTLTIADLVYLIRIVVGDAKPFPDGIPTIQGKYLITESGTIIILEDLAVGASKVVVKGNVTPTLLAENMSMKYNFDGTNTSILVYSLENHNFTGNMINIGYYEIVSIEAADKLGHPIELNYMPPDFALKQNYPNPFYPTTIIEMIIPTTSEVSLVIRNYSNQVIYSIVKVYEAGIHQFEFDGTNYASGYYSYTMTANGFEQTKTMLLLK